MYEKLAVYVVWIVEGALILFVFSVLCTLLIYPLRKKNFWIAITAALILFCLFSFGIGYLLNN